jgi:uncharacterized SAM-binding protein YcdF (DUF218 family)
MLQAERILPLHSHCIEYMNTTWLLTNVAVSLLLPPLSLILLCVAGGVVRRRWPRIGNSISLGALLVLLILSTDAGARLIAAPLEALTRPMQSAKGTHGQAIVILGGGRMKDAPEYGGHDIPNSHTLARLAYGAKLHRETALPILVTGGTPDGAGESEAAVMARTLQEDFGSPVRWLEQGSNNTAENAQRSIQLLKQAGIQRILLVTDAMHMPRSHMIFKRYGFTVIPAPTRFLTSSPLSAADFIPRARALANSHYAMHEWIGLYWYRFRHQ